MKGNDTVKVAIKPSPLNFLAVFLGNIGLDIQITLRSKRGGRVISLRCVIIIFNPGDDHGQKFQDGIVLGGYTNELLW